jgi:hypothetical protein
MRGNQFHKFWATSKKQPITEIEIPSMNKLLVATDFLCYHFRKKMVHRGIAWRGADNGAL